MRREEREPFPGGSGGEKGKSGGDGGEASALRRAELSAVSRSAGFARKDTSKGRHQILMRHRTAARKLQLRSAFKGTFVKKIQNSELNSFQNVLRQVSGDVLYCHAAGQYAQEFWGLRKRNVLGVTSF